MRKDCNERWGVRLGGVGARADNPDSPNQPPRRQHPVHPLIMPLLRNVIHQLTFKADTDEPCCRVSRTLLVNPNIKTAVSAAKPQSVTREGAARDKGDGEILRVQERR